ncbi:MAG TPA: hypothetical protein VM871_12355 [Flavisolibacter sp.]|nr:hypothetical protein [Flavisolibacter sp.]
MEFTCVFSVGGSLATYSVQKEAINQYRATLRADQGSRADIPDRILLEKTGSGWQATPPAEEILKNLVHAIEATGDFAVL